jgi:hypothetical protein
MFKKYNTILLLAVCALFLWVYVSGSNIIGGKRHWDFRAHYFSTKAYEAGLNPYNNRDVNRVNRSGYTIPAWMTYPYHPITLNYFKLFTKFEYDEALRIYLIYNLFLIFFLIILWKAYFIKENILILLFAILWLFSFNETIGIGLKAANPVFLETAIIWIAFAFLIHNRSLPFLILLGIISLFKGGPILLTPLVFLLPKDKKRIFFEFVAILTFFGIIILWPYFSNPLLFNSWLKYASNVKETGITNPCSYALIINLFKKIGLRESWFIINSTYALWVGMVMLAYMFVVKKLKWDANKILIIFFSLLTYAIIAPRFKDYAYIQLLPISYFLGIKNIGIMFFNLFGVFTRRIGLPFFIKQYHAFFAAVISWGYLAYYLLRSKIGSE